MVRPSFDQVQRAAYARWERRGFRHGQDGEDWLAAEQELLFALNYEVVAHYPLAGPGAQVLGDRARPVCRFCERGAPATTFASPAPAAPECLGNATLLTVELCDECRAQFEEGIDRDLARFVVSATKGEASPDARPLRVPAAALKGFARVALAIMPRRDIASFEDAIEWVGNPDHEFDEGLFTDLGGFVHRRQEPSATSPWVALARRLDDEAAVPYMLLFAATAAVVFEVPVPLCVRDEDLDGEVVVVPRVCSPLPERHDCGADSCRWLPIFSSDSRRAVVSC